MQPQCGSGAFAANFRAEGGPPTRSTGFSETMLVLLFSIGEDRYGLPALAVFEVTPQLDLKQLPGVPDFVAGLCNFRGQAMPVLDISALARGLPCRPLLSTRMIVVNYTLADGSVKPLGLLAERATETLRIAGADLQAAGVRADGALFLGKVAVGATLVQLIDVPNLLTPDARALLFPELP